MGDVVDKALYSCAFICILVVLAGAALLAWYIWTDLFGPKPEPINSPKLLKARSDIKKRERRLTRERQALESFLNEETLDVAQIQEIFSNGMD